MFLVDNRDIVSNQSINKESDMKVILIVFVAALVLYLPVVLKVGAAIFSGAKACGVC